MIVKGEIVNQKMRKIFMFVDYYIFTTASQFSYYITHQYKMIDLLNILCFIYSVFYLISSAEVLKYCRIFM